MGRKDRERFQRLRETNPDYAGYRGLDTASVRSPTQETVTMTCSTCQRKRNVTAVSLPEDMGQFICMRCQEDMVRPQ